jgi:hypothetical protein
VVLLDNAYSEVCFPCLQEEETIIDHRECGEYLFAMTISDLSPFPLIVQSE